MFATSHTEAHGILNQSFNPAKAPGSGPVDEPFTPHSGRALLGLDPGRLASQSSTSHLHSLYLVSVSLSLFVRLSKLAPTTSERAHCYVERRLTIQAQPRPLLREDARRPVQCLWKKDVLICCCVVEPEAPKPEALCTENQAGVLRRAALHSELSY